MSYNYQLSPLEILELLGCEPAPGYQPDQRLPRLLNDFLSRAASPLGQQLFRTADIWTSRPARFLYDDIADTLKRHRDYWAKHPDKWQDSEYYPFGQLPREQWPQLMPDYLQIGSDYAAGVVEFALRAADLALPEPRFSSILRTRPWANTNSSAPISRAICSTPFAAMCSAAKITALPGRCWRRQAGLMRNAPSPGASAGSTTLSSALPWPAAMTPPAIPCCRC